MIRDRFPIIKHHPDLIYLDNAATTHRPDTVIESMNTFYESGNSNTHRGVYSLSARATRDYEETREQTAKFLHTNPENIAFTRGTTESINIIAQGYLSEVLQPGDNVVTTIMEHHSNFIPWQMCCRQSGGEFRVVPVDKDGRVDIEDIAGKIDGSTKMVSICHISNALGTLNPIQEIISVAQQKGVPVFIDAAQSAGLYELNTDHLDCDFLAFSAHKAFGPFGVGILYAHDRIKGLIKPITFGGGMVEQVETGGSSFRQYPYHLDVGTMNIAGVIGWGKTLNFINELDIEKERDFIGELARHASQKLNKLDNVSVVGKTGSGIVSFHVHNVHPHDIATLLNEDHIAVRAGMHCTQPLMDNLNLPGTVRASFSIYNTEKEVDQLISSVKNAVKILG